MTTNNNQLYSRRWWIVGAVLTGTWVGTLGNSMMPVALPSIVNQYGVGLNLGVWVISVYVLLVAVLMPIFGWLAGKELLVYISSYDHWAAFGLLAFVGGRMLWEARLPKRPETTGDPTRGLMLVTLSLATSIDALAVGMSMALAGISIWLPCAVIGLVAAALTAVGITFGSRFGPRLGRWAEAAGGCVLILIGVRILLEHLSAS